MTEKELRVEHRELFRLVNLIILNDIDSIWNELNELKSTLENHIKHEVGPNGFYHKLGLVHSEFEDEVDILLDDHRVMLEMLNNIILEFLVKDDLPLIRANIKEFLCYLTNHEHAELNLIRRSKMVNRERKIPER